MFQDFVYATNDPLSTSTVATVDIGRTLDRHSIVKHFQYLLSKDVLLRKFS